VAEGTIQAGPGGWGIVALAGNPFVSYGSGRGMGCSSSPKAMKTHKEKPTPASPARIRLRLPGSRTSEPASVQGGRSPGRQGAVRLSNALAFAPLALFIPEFLIPDRAAVRVFLVKAEPKNNFRVL
jgi:hypothetical protein